MYPPQVSLIPVQIALARFFESRGFLALAENYPYWYLGTTPFRYLTGPVIPLAITALHKIFPSLSLFPLFYFLIAGFWLVGGGGVYLLTRELATASLPAGKTRGAAGNISAAVAFFYLFGPIIPFLFRFGDGRYFCAFSFLPLCLFAYFRFLIRGKMRQAVILIICLSFVILIDSLILPTLILGMMAIFLAYASWKTVGEKLKETGFMVTLSLLIATFWYTPGYWLTLLGAPSLRGKELIGVIGDLGRILPTAVAVSAAVLAASRFKRENYFGRFSFFWLAVFGFLTALRFLSDPDFWLDWTSYGTEIQLGLALVGGWRAGRFLSSAEKKMAGIIFGFLGFFLPLVVFLLLSDRYVLGAMQKEITAAVEYQIGRELEKRARAGERVFLSGTTAFWLNAFFDIPQVRGGVDQAAVGNEWREAVWEIREGHDGQKSLEWLKKMRVAYLVVHEKLSREFYHDFEYPEKFVGLVGLEEIYNFAGDRIYRVRDF